jgi:homoserine O-acetyltransferase
MLFHCEQALRLESGAILPSYHLDYSTYGTLNATGDNVVWVFHALTANSDPVQWWPGLVGEGKLFDPSTYYIVCVNMPGSCYGSIGPLDRDPERGEAYYHTFPFFTPRDMIRAYQPLRRSLGINRIHAGIGGSMGGQQLLEWAIEEPELFDHIIPIATNARHSPWGIAFNTTQRMAIEADPSWKERSEHAGLNGMKVARAVAILSYRQYDTYEQGQPRTDDFFADRGPGGTTAGDAAGAAGNEVESGAETGGAAGRTGAASYQRYQGEKLARRFNAFSYYALSQSMDAHDTGRGRGGAEIALQRIKARTLVIGIESDILFPLSEQQFLARWIPGATYHPIPSLYGHDGFLLEYEQIGGLVSKLLQRHRAIEY